MANRVKGQVAFEIDGAEFYLRLSTNAICELEERTGKGINEFAAGLDDPSKFKMSDLRIMFFCMCENQAATPSDAGIMIDQLGMSKATELVAAAFKAAFPEQEEKSPGK